MVLSEEGTKDRTLSRNIGRFGGFLVSDLIDQPKNVSNPSVFRGSMSLRLKADNVTHQLALIPLLVGHLAGPVDHLNTLHPFVCCELDLSSPVVHVPYKARHDLFHPRRGLRTRSIDDMLGEVRVETLLCATHDGDGYLFEVYSFS